MDGRLRFFGPSLERGLRIDLKGSGFLSHEHPSAGQKPRKERISTQLEQRRQVQPGSHGNNQEPHSQRLRRWKRQAPVTNGDQVGLEGECESCLFVVRQGWVSALAGISSP